MKAIQFKFVPENTKGAFHYAHGHIILGDHFSDGEDRFLSEECVSVREVENAVNRLKRQLDQVLIKAKKKFKD